MTNVAVRELPAETLRWDLDRADPAISAFALALLLIGLGGSALGFEPARAFGLMLFAVFGFGSAVTQVFRRHYMPALAFGPAVGLSVAILTGFALVEAHVWRWGPVLYVVFAAAASLVHLVVLARSTPGFIRSTASGRTRVLPSLMVGRGRPLLIVALSGIGLAACLASAAAIDGRDLTGPAGIFAILSPAWYGGVICLVVAVIAGLRMGGRTAGLAVICLSLALTLTPSIAYVDPHAPWAAKQVGVTSFILLHGKVNANFDIAQNWPGLFSAVAWASRAAGIHDPMVVARWWSPFIDLVTLLAFEELAFRALGNRRQSWIAALFFVVGNTIGQDYYSPQSTGYLLAIAIFALVLQRADAARRLSRSEVKKVFKLTWLIHRPPAQPPFTWPAAVVLIGLSVAMAVTHQLSPFIAAGVTVVLALLGMARTRWAAAIILVPAVGWTLLNLSVVSRYFKLSQIGQITTNILPKGLANPSLHKSALIETNALSMGGDVLLIGLVALVVLVRHRTMSNVAFALCALSGLGLFLANSYGNEGIFRIALFALPWLALLAAQWTPRTIPRMSWIPWLVMPPLVGAYLFANLGLDFIRVIRPSDLSAIQTYENTAPARSKLYILGYNYAPTKETAQYNYGYILESYYPSVVSLVNGKFDPKASYDEFIAMLESHGGLTSYHRYYVLSAEEPRDGMGQLHLSNKAEYAAVSAEFADSPNWQLVAQTKSARLWLLQWMILQLGNPGISGSVVPGQFLNASPGKWDSVNHLRISYQWQDCAPDNSKCTSISKATYRSYRIGEGDEGSRLRVVVTATDSLGHSVSTAAETREVVPEPGIVNTALPTIVGTDRVAGGLGVSRGTWNSGVNKLTFSYQWELCSATGTNCSPIAGATSDKLQLNRSEAGDTVLVVVTARDAHGEHSEAVAHDATPIQALPRPPRPPHVPRPVIPKPPKAPKPPRAHPTTPTTKPTTTSTLPGGRPI